MPVRRRSLRQRKSLRLADLDMARVMCFIAAWRPPDEEWESLKSQIPDTAATIDRADWIAAARARTWWGSWSEYLSEYELIRDEVLNTPHWQQGNPWFAETVLQERRGR